ncbi:MAG TPA: DNA polymerase III subunit delta [Gammaproteobacteria bacterium]|nr:DNA polymerase III subunit delta [Gammaproteobacteria bacterium]
MKIALQQLEQHVAKSLAPIYLISGDETLLVQEAVDFLRKYAQQKGFSERVRITTEAGSDWGKLLHTHAHSLSLFADYRLLELDLRGVKLNQANAEWLQDYAENPAENTVLILSLSKLDAKTEQSKWVKAIDKKGVMVPIWPVSTEQLPQWILQRAKKSGLTLTGKAAAHLAYRVEGNLLAAAQEIEKLSLLQLQHDIDENTLEAIISDHAHFDVFQLVDSVLSGNGKRALHILQTLFGEETEPTLILWALTRELSTLSDMHQQQKQGVALSTLFGKFRIWEKRQAPVRAFLKRCPETVCWNFLLQAAEIDRIIKGVEPGNACDRLEQLVLGMAGHPPAGL